MGWTLAISGKYRSNIIMFDQHGFWNVCVFAPLILPNNWWFVPRKPDMVVGHRFLRFWDSTGFYTVCAGCFIQVSPGHRSKAEIFDELDTNLDGRVRRAQKASPENWCERRSSGGWYHIFFKLGVSKNSGFSLKMDGENNGKPYKNGWFGETPTIFGKFPNLYLGIMIQFHVDNMCSNELKAINLR